MAYDNTDGRIRGRKLQATRLRVWAQDPHCAMCRKLVAYPAGFELDHKRALHKDGSTNDDDNMQVLCPPCHATKTAQDCGYRERAEFDAGGYGEGFLPVARSGGIFEGLQFGFHAGDSTQTANNCKGQRPREGK